MHSNLSDILYKSRPRKSGYSVGAAVRDIDDRVVTAGNIKNSITARLSTCAEALALLKSDGDGQKFVSGSGWERQQWPGDVDNAMWVVSAGNSQQLPGQEGRQDLRDGRGGTG